MKNVLIISQFFSDNTEIAASRIKGLAKFLPKFGWEPVILTATSSMKPDPQFNVIEVPFVDTCTKWKKRLGLDIDDGLKDQLNKKVNHTVRKKEYTITDKIVDFLGECCAYPDAATAWLKPAVNTGNNILKSESFDAIISSSGPATCHLIARKLKENHGLPWIADFRDLWTQNHYCNYSKIRSFFERRLEMETLSSVDAMTTVSPPLVEKLKNLHIGKDIYSIPNGFDPAQLNPGKALSTNFTITYTGKLYRGRRDPGPLFLALNDLISDRLIDPRDLSVEFYGYKEDWLQEDIEKYNLGSIVTIGGRISRKESIEKQRCSHLLLLLTWDNPAEIGVYTGKVFDYLAAKRPILSIGMSDGVIGDLLNETHAGFNPSSQMALKQCILEAYLEYKSKGTVVYQGIPSEIGKYNHIEMARKFSVILKKLTEIAR